MLGVSTKRTSRQRCEMKVRAKSDVNADAKKASWLAALFFILPLLLFTFSVEAATSLVKLESLGFDQVCGLDTTGKTSCVKGGDESTVVPDPVGVLTSGFSNELLSCGFDADGLKCWRLYGGAELVDGVNSTQAIRAFFGKVKTDSIRLSSTSICGVETSGELNCAVPYWYRSTKHSVHIKPTVKITAIGLNEEAICWGDGNAQESEIKCASDSSSPAWRKNLKMTDLNEIAVGQNWVCGRSKTEAKCWNDTAPVALPADFANAFSWGGNADGLCALTRDQRVVCANPITGAIEPAGRGHAIPAVYASPNPEIKQFWTSKSSACILENSGIVNCWNWWNPTASINTFSRPAQSLFGDSYLPCAILDNGQAECRLSSYESRTLQNTDRIRVDFGGYNKCFWNSAGVDCRGRFDNLSFRSVKDLASSRGDESTCVIGVASGSAVEFDTVQCFSQNPTMRAPPFDLTNPAKVATTGDQACALSDEGLTCWGTMYADTAYPKTVMNPTKLVMSTRHGCVLDRFGLACWGELTALNLEIPSGLEQPGRVIDVAVGASRTCAILDDATVSCWGRDYELSGPPPTLQKPTSIIGRGGLFCAVDATGLHCWGGSTNLPN